jgi:hypothetical protein
MASCQAAKLPLALIFWARPTIWGELTTTVSDGFPADNADGASVVFALPIIAKHRQITEQTQEPLFLMKQLISKR